MKKSHPFSNNLIQIININSNNISHVSSPHNPQPQNHRYLDLMSKLDQIIADSRKTQEFILEKQINKHLNLNQSTTDPKLKSNKPFPPSPSKQPPYKLVQILKEITIPVPLQTPLITNQALGQIIQKNLSTPSKTPFTPPPDSFKKPLQRKIEYIQYKTGFNMLSLIEDLYELALINRLEESPIGKSFIKGKIFNKKTPLIKPDFPIKNNKDFSCCQLPFEEDLAWKQLDKSQTDSFFYKENLTENIQPNYLTGQWMDTSYTRLLGVVLKTKTGINC